MFSYSTNKKLAIALAAILTFSTSSIYVSAKEPTIIAYDNQTASQTAIIEEAKSLVEQALNEKSFYKYNISFAKIMQITDAVERNLLLSQLGTISSEIYTKDILHFNELLASVAQTGSGRVYDNAEAEMRSSTLSEVDKGYLLGELTSWGRQMVYTSDYTAALDKIIEAWYCIKDSTKINSAITAAENAIGSVKNTYNKQYLYEQLDEIKRQLEASVITTQSAYKAAIKKALENFDETLSLTIEGYDETVYNFDMMEKIINEYPTIDYGYNGASGMLSWIEGSSTYTMDITFKYKKTKEVMLMMKSKTEQKSAEILKNIIKPEMKDYQKALAIHDYVVNNSNYDEENYNKDTIPAESYTDYGVLVLGKAVCEGYAKAMFRLLNAAGVKTLYVTGTANGIPHAWNIVQLGGEYYHIDSTWDDPLTGGRGSVLRHDYFNITDSVMAKDHIWDRSKYPECNSTRYAYGNIN
jgi:hypothetical protein